MSSFNATNGPRQLTGQQHRLYNIYYQHYRNLGHDATTANNMAYYYVYNLDNDRCTAEADTIEVLSSGFQRQRGGNGDSSASCFKLFKELVKKGLDEEKALNYCKILTDNQCKNIENTFVPQVNVEQQTIQSAQLPQETDQQLGGAKKRDSSKKSSKTTKKTSKKSSKKGSKIILGGAKKSSKKYNKM